MLRPTGAETVGWGQTIRGSFGRAEASCQLLLWPYKLSREQLDLSLFDRPTLEGDAASHYLGTRHELANA